MGANAKCTVYDYMVLYDCYRKILKKVGITSLSIIPTFLFILNREHILQSEHFLRIYFRLS